MSHPTSQFPCAYGFSTRQLAYMLDSLVRVSRRAHWRPYASTLRAQITGLGALRSSVPHAAQALDTEGVLPRAKPVLTSSRRVTAAGGRPLSPRASRPANDFPLNNFKHFLTLFSKFFSSFPHGTCSLSVSRQYLALDGTYHQLRAAFPNNPTLRSRSRATAGDAPTGFSPSATTASTALGRAPR
jgi:hypothetical protein